MYQKINLEREIRTLAKQLFVAVRSYDPESCGTGLVYYEEAKQFILSLPPLPEDEEQERAGEPWSKKEATDLIEAHRLGATVQNLASRHNRSIGSIKSRLIKLHFE